MVHFDTELFWLQLHSFPIMCMNRKYGEQIGGTVGNVMDVVVDTDDTGWGHYLRIWVEIPLSKSLARGRLIYVNDEKPWIPVKFEKLKQVCFSCKIINYASF